MCGKDRAQRGVYKLKREHERGRGEQKKKRKRTDINKKEERKSGEKELHWLLKKTFIVPTGKPLTFLRVNLLKRDHS